MLYYLTRNIKFTIPIGLHNTFDRFGHVMNKNYPDNTVSAYIQFFNVLCWHCSVIAGELLDVRRNV